MALCVCCECVCVYQEVVESVGFPVLKLSAVTHSVIHCIFMNACVFVCVYGCVFVCVWVCVCVDGSGLTSLATRARMCVCEGLVSELIM